MNRHFIGIDIQVSKKCCYAVIDDTGKLIDSGWFSNTDAEAVGLIKKLIDTPSQVEVGIDAPRRPLNSKRQWYWNKSTRQWKKRKTQKGYGRHSEVILSAHRIANPQWTPLKNEAPSWMNLGFKLFCVLEDIVRVHEVFPTASYALLEGIQDVRIIADFSACNPGPKDMLDSWVAAVTVREFAEGRGCEVGDGDGMGSIILPRPLPQPVIAEVLTWPK
jgi:predicted nuclease with RNAse H fold